MSSVLNYLGISDKVKINRNLTAEELCDISVKKGHGKYTKTGALLVKTGKHTGRSPKDRFLVKESKTEHLVNWNNIHKPVSEEVFDILFKRITDYLSAKKDIYMFDGCVGADPQTTKKTRMICEYPHIAFFLSKLLRNLPDAEENNFNEDLLLISAADLHISDWKELGLASESFIVTHLSKNIVIVGGTHYAGERKKSVFSWMNFILPDMDICPMHCSANTSMDQSDSALFFGLSGTGKTTLSADEHRLLIGDDEHGWKSDNSVFNMEGGCYAKGIDLEKDKEPIIWAAIKNGALVENVVEKEEINDLNLDFSDTSLTQNSRIGYGLENVPNRVDNSIGQNVKTIVFLTADASGTLPPISKLSIPQAKYHYLSGYTSKLAGTEVGIDAPQVTFSAYFGEPFFARKPSVYADILAKRISENDNVSVFLLNTGWNGTGKRISLKNTRTMVTAALEGKLDNANYHSHPVFKLSIPDSCPGLSDSSILNPENTWKNKDLYWKSANKLAEQFVENIKRFKNLDSDIIESGPSPINI
ncbi:MAG TPA: phosphoenolpyruvate carboxykinase (ATP) [Victivallales bacterium]|nr:phosphoenolpyruvate carboxykinase (ATP) [Victivallales bacterium]